METLSPSPLLSITSSEMSHKPKDKKIPHPPVDGGHLKRTLRRIPTNNDPMQNFNDAASTMDVISMAGHSDTATFRAAGRYENTYKLEPDIKFNATSVEKVTKGILEERLSETKYDASTCKLLSQDLAGVIMERIKQMPFKRYKFVAVVSIGSLEGRPGMQFGSRCLWNQSTDTFANVTYSNTSLFAVAMVYALFYE